MDWGWYSVAPAYRDKGTCFPHLLQSSFLGISSSSCYGQGLHPSQRFFLFSSGKSGSFARKYAASRSGISLSTYVVLSARYLNPNVHVRSPWIYVRRPNESTADLSLFLVRVGVHTIITSSFSLRRNAPVWYRYAVRIAGRCVSVCI